MRWLWKEGGALQHFLGCGSDRQRGKTLDPEAGNGGADNRKERVTEEGGQKLLYKFPSDS